ncbi:hypothetical protein GGR22_000717 [Flavobacterium gossypii]|uniref:Two-component sensor histidine kinase n=1 Tax=Flavobacterium gossypii TaxID=1646119 RepID=A0ABR6DMQ0_9FLAO|nr:hypothetical protein [Flavobacterium gossypii]MBA9072591.1 hypothetical protein [Flavobacterium gossypii]
MKYLVIVCFLVLSLFVVKQYDEINNLNSKIDSLSGRLEKSAICDTETLKELSKQQYKEDFYLNQLSNSTTLILSVIGFALVLAGVSSYFIIDEKLEIIKQNFRTEHELLSTLFTNTINTQNISIDTFRKDMNANTTQNIADYKELEHKMLDVKNDLDFESATIKHNEGNEALSYGQLGVFIFFRFRSMSSTSKNIAYYKSRKLDDLAQSSIDLLNSRLENLHSKIENYITSNNLQKYRLSDIDYDRKMLMYDISEINKEGNIKTFDLTNKIYGFLDFTEENQNTDTN